MPAWAKTEKQQEVAKEQEIDELLEFAYELDYEKYMEDQEVRMALAVIKDRVQEITKDVDWKQKMADEWNKANEEEAIEGLKSYERPADMKSNASQSKSHSFANIIRFRDWNERCLKTKLLETRR